MSGSLMRRRSNAITSADRDADRRPADRRPGEVGGDAPEGHASADGGDGAPQRDEGRRVVEQRLALEDGDDAARQADPSGDGGGRDGVGRRHDRAECDRRGQRDGQQPERDEPDDGRGEQHQPDGKQADGTPEGLDVDERRADRGRVQQGRQQADEDELRAERDGIDERQERDGDADDHEQQGSRQPEAGRHRADGGHRRDESQDRERDRHLAVVHACSARPFGTPVPRHRDWRCALRGRAAVMPRG